ncbi:WD repeat-containing protein 64-like isoform X3 [Gopherus flavomarginatus]|nr:WD repeat-containing protein 64-like isoform X3 [Gopherus flavomarginatus]XP_050802250.1 WD repeat-containing protein 64-like isoform X3 [Gopherus flavomarginatus]XP_050802251.1 WD repeat-containing protein 64-like isoform X3 [Gopherus flavomarginatus]
MPHREPLLHISPTVDNNIIGVGQDGLVSIWTRNLKLKKSRLILNSNICIYLYIEPMQLDFCMYFHLTLSSWQFPFGLQNENKVLNRKLKWISDSTLMSQYNKLIIGTCDREIRLYELSNFEPYCQITGLETMPLHLDYSVREEDECIILYGDEQGCVNIILISSVGETLRNWTKCPAVEEIPSVSMENINDSRNITFIRWKVHNDWVTKIKYINSIESIISSSNDDYTALVIGCVNETKDVQHRLRILMDSSSFPTKCSLPGGASPPRRFNCDESQFKVHRGVKAFDFCKESNILVTGGLDRNIRLWNPYVPGWAIGLLRGHTSPIGFLCIADGNTKLFSVSMDCTVKVWDIEDQSCLLTMIPKANQIRGEMSVCYFSNELRALYLAADCLVLLHFQQKEDRLSNSCMSHNEPILCCQYNRPFRQVVSCSEGSAIKVWDLQNGQLVTEVYEAHGDAAVTCMALDTSGKRLITGGRDGSLKKWDCSTIRYIHTLKQGTSSDEVTACTYADIYSNRYIISVGWDRKINIFPDLHSEATEGRCPQVDWIDSVENGHKDDVLCVSFCPPNLVASSSYDGEILIWNLISGHICNRLSAVSQAVMEDGTEDLIINKVTFLQSRSERKMTAASLVSSGPRGYITFWNIFGGGKLFAYFIGSKDRSTLSDMAVSDDDCLLCAADHIGYIYIWNITKYALQGPEEEPPACEQHFLLPFQSQCPLTLSHVADSCITDLYLIFFSPSRCQVLLSWRAHSCSVTSVAWVSEDRLLLTSSVDCTVKLWSLEGEYIGTFGQKDLWNIKDRMSWQRGPNPDSHITPAAPARQVSAIKPSCATESEDEANSAEPESQVASPLSLIKDDEIAEELKQRQKAKSEHRAHHSQLKCIKHETRALTTYHSLQLCELTCLPATFHKLNPRRCNDPDNLAF